VTDHSKPFTRARHVFYTPRLSNIGYWTMTGTDRADGTAMAFIKISASWAASRCCTSGTGKYSIDALFGIALP
jgi:hypothetical protein